MRTDFTLPNIDLGKTRITDKIMVSTAAIYYKEWFGERYQLETWIFSEDKTVQKSHQVIHCSTNTTIPQRRIDDAKRVHKYISDNLLKKFNQCT